MKVKKLKKKNRNTFPSKMTQNSNGDKTTGTAE